MTIFACVSERIILDADENISYPDASTMEPPGGTYNSSSAKAFDDFTAIVCRGFVVIENFVNVSRLDDDEDEDDGAHRLVKTAEAIEVVILFSVI